MVRIAALALMPAVLAGCQASRLIAGYAVPASDAALAQPFPTLADGPTHAVPPAPGPDSAAGAAVAAGLVAEARAAAARAAELAGPVVPVEALRREAAAARAGR